MEIDSLQSKHFMNAQTTYYEESKRYLNFARKMLRGCRKDEEWENIYANVVRIKAVAGVAYLGVEKAAKALIEIKLGEKAEDIDDIRNFLKQFDLKAFDSFLECNETLRKHIYRYDDRLISHMKGGLHHAKIVIDTLRPYNEIAKLRSGGIVDYPYHMDIVGMGQEYFIADDRFPTHDSYAVCMNCREFFTYDSNSDLALERECPECGKLAFIKPA